MKRFATGMLIMAALLVFFACGAMAETAYLTDPGVPVEEAEIRLVTLGYMTQGSRLISPDELEPVEGVEGLYALALTEEESAAYAAIMYGGFTYNGMDRAQDLYAVRVQTQGIVPDTIGSLRFGNSSLHYPQETPSAGDIDLTVACPEAFALSIFATHETDADYAGKRICDKEIDLGDIAVGETMTIEQEPENGYDAPFTILVTKELLLGQAVPSYVDLLTEEPFTLYFMDIGLDMANMRITTNGYLDDADGRVFQPRTLSAEEYTIEADAPEGMIAVTFDPQVTEADGYTYRNIAFTMEADEEVPAMQSSANRVQELTDGLYLYSAKFDGVELEELNRFMVRLRGIDNPATFHVLCGITPVSPAGEERTLLPDGLLDRMTFVAGDIVLMYLGRHREEGESFRPYWEMAENLAAESLDVGDSFETFIMMSGEDIGNHDFITITITKEAILRDR